MFPVTIALIVILATDDSPPPPDAVKIAIEKALKRVETGLTNYPTHRACFSCHHHATGVMCLTAAKASGFAVSDAVVKDAVAFSLRTFRNRDAISQGRGVGGDSTGVVYILHTLAAVEHKPDATTAALVEYLLVKQLADGAWPIPARGDRPPTMGSLFTNTGLAVGALKRFPATPGAKGSDKLQKRIDAAVAKGRGWLLANRPDSTEDRVFRLRGLVDAGAEPKDVAAARDELLRWQLADGSWAQLRDMTGDAYATGTALAALRHSGLESTHAAYRRGVKYLLRSQDETGAWLVKTRAKPLQVYFDNGDLGGKSQFISFAATNWAVMALLEVAPGRAARK
jgi:N-acyl-D-amino-acid deacylase